MQNLGLSSIAVGCMGVSDRVGRKNREKFNHGVMARVVIVLKEDGREMSADGISSMLSSRWKRYGCSISELGSIIPRYAEDYGVEVAHTKTKSYKLRTE